MNSVREVNADLPDNQMIRILVRAKEAGCKFTVGTDSHSVKGLEMIGLGEQIAACLQLTCADLADFVAYAVE